MAVLLETANGNVSFLNAACLIKTIFLRYEGRTPKNLVCFAPNDSAYCVTWQQAQSIIIQLAYCPGRVRQAAGSAIGGRDS